MSVAALEINDSALTLVSEGKVLSSSPGYALLGREPPVVGGAAQRAARLEPIAANSRFWSELDASPLPGAVAGGRSRADLAWLHLKHMLEELPQRPDGLICAVPASMRAHQLSMLLGIAGESGLQVRGLIDSAVAVASAWSGHGRFIYLDLHLHQALMSAVQVDEEARLERSEIKRNAGLLALQEVWARLIARRFVTHTRFDPMHRAADEQTLFNALPGWLEQLRSQPSIEIEMAFGAERHRIQLTQEELRLEAAPIYGSIVLGLRRLRRAGHPIVIGVSGRSAQLPGLVEQLADLHDSIVMAVPAGGAALAALAHQNKYAAGGDNATLLRAVPRLSSDAAANLAPRELSVAQQANKAAAPTHVLYRGQAYPLSAQPLVVGLEGEEQAPLRALQIAGATAGISRLHCSLLRSDSAAEVIDFSRYGTWLNDERIAGRARLHAGDRVRVGSPGVTLELIALE